jgi:small conductance mechanosensitive channel
MTHRKLIPCVSILPIIHAFAADQTAGAIADKGKQTLEWWKERVGHLIETQGPALFGAMLVLAGGVYAGRLVGNVAMRWLEQKPIEPPVRLLMVRIARLLVVVMALVIALGTAGVDVTALVAGIGVAGVGVGLAMQGVLGNLFAGLVIIFTKPFRVGEYVELLGVQGQVEMIELLSTKLVHTDRSRVVIPNRKIIGEILHNYGTVRQLDLVVGVSYDSNLTETIALVRDMLNQHPRVLKDPAPLVGVSMLADSSINLAIRPWTKVADFGPASAELYQAIVERFRERNISIPFPQREVRLLDNH